jgi:hypothetical protein
MCLGSVGGRPQPVFDHPQGLRAPTRSDGRTTALRAWGGEAATRHPLPRARSTSACCYGVLLDTTLLGWPLITVCWLSWTFSVFVTVGSTFTAVPIFA